MNKVHTFGKIRHLSLSLLLVIFGVYESQSASLLQTSTQVKDAIQGNKDIIPQPQISIGHFGGDDKKPLSLIKKGNDKQNQDQVQPYQNKVNKNEPEIVSLIGDTSSLNQLRLSKREARLIIGALDRQTCFAKVLCGLGSKAPTKNTDLINDYAYLVGELVANSDEDNGKQSTTILSDVWDEFGALKELKKEQDGFNDDGSDEENDDDEVRSLLDSGIKNGGDAAYIKLRPFQHRIVHPRFIFKRFGRQISEGRQCRQLMETNACPYNDTQMKNIVTKLRQIMRGENIFGTIRNGASQIASIALGSQSTKSSSGTPEKMNVIINLHQNWTIPPQQTTGFATFPLGMSQLYGATPSTFRSNESFTLHRSNGNNTSSASSNQPEMDTTLFKPFYTLPILLPTPSTPPTQVQPSKPPTVDPFQQLAGFLYTVGYANNETKHVGSSQLYGGTPPSQKLTDEDDSEEMRALKPTIVSLKKKEDEDEEDEDSEEFQGNLRKQAAVPKREMKKFPKKVRFPKNGQTFLRIKTSQRTGRFHAVGDSNVNFLEASPPLPQFHKEPEMPILLRAIRFLSSIFRGGPIGY